MHNRMERILPLACIALAAHMTACGSAQKGDGSSAAPTSNGEIDTQTQIDHYLTQAGLAISEGDKQGAFEYYVEAAGILDEAGGDTIQKADVHYEAAGLAYEIGEKERAIEEYDIAVNIYRRFSGNTRIKAANALNNMGTIYKEFDRKGKARSCWEEALQIYRQAPKELQNSANMAMIEQNIRDMSEGF